MLLCIVYFSRSWFQNLRDFLALLSCCLAWLLWSWISPNWLHSITTTRSHFREKLHLGTPECVILFLAGSLPATSLLHLSMMSLLGMIERLGPNNILNQHATNILLDTKPSKSWFTSIRSLCNKYSLPDPLLTLQTPASKLCWKKLCKSRVVDWREQNIGARLNFLHLLYISSLPSCHSQHPTPCGLLLIVLMRLEKPLLLQ